MKIYRVDYVQQPDDKEYYSLVAVGDDADAQRACEVLRENLRRKGNGIVVGEVKFVHRIHYADARLPEFWPMPSRN